MNNPVFVEMYIGYAIVYLYNLVFFLIKKVEITQVIFLVIGHTFFAHGKIILEDKRDFQCYILFLE